MSTENLSDPVHPVDAAIAKKKAQDRALAELMHNNAIKRLEVRALRIVVALRDMAEDIEREVRGNANSVNQNSQLAADILHTIQWGFANLSLDQLVLDAADADKNFND